MLEQLNQFLKSAIRRHTPENLFRTRTYFQHRLDVEKQRAERNGEKFTVVILGFKKLKTDLLPSLSRHETLEFIDDLATAAFRLIRQIDVAAWYDSDSVAIILCDTSFIGARKFLKRLNNEFLTIAAQKTYEDLFLLNKIDINMYTYPDNYQANNKSLYKPVSLSEFNIIEPVNLNGQLSKEFKNSSRKLLKRSIDVVLSYIGLLIFAPLMAVIAIMIKLTSSGPIIYRQKRVGYNGKIFELYKFRSMYVDADENVHRRHIADVMHNENQSYAEHAPSIKIIRDERVTPVGRFLRNTCLDELPQLVNVLKGDMSLVGPRPHPEYEVFNYDNWYKRRLTVKPGLTGLWQIQGKKRMFYSDAIRLDLSYIDRWSLGLDLKILCYTLPTALAGLGTDND